MGPIKVWLLVMAGTWGGSAVWGTGAGVSPHMFNSYADCQKVAVILDGVNAKCVFVTVFVKK